MQIFLMTIICIIVVTPIHITKLMLSTYSHIEYLTVLIRNEYIKHPPWYSEHPDNLRYVLITFMLHYTLHSGDKALTQGI